MAKATRGGQTKHWAEKLRILIWYKEVARRDFSKKKTDHTLDQLFAWKDDHPFDISIKKSDLRPRVFENIRKNYREPKWGEGLRNMDELVNAVDQHEKGKGTKDLYNAVFWEFLKNINPKSAYVQRCLEDLFIKHKIKRINPLRSNEVSAEILRVGKDVFFDKCLRYSIYEIDKLDAIAMIWLVHLQAEAPSNAYIRVVTERLLDTMLDGFYRQQFGFEDKQIHYYALSIDALQKSRLDISDIESDGYGFLEEFAQWPLLR